MTPLSLPGRVAASRFDELEIGWRDGYVGAPKAHTGPTYMQGWRLGHEDRILRRATDAVRSNGRR